MTIFAYALGEESFVDANGNNLFETGETYTDLGEPFRNDRAITAANANYINDAYSAGNTSRVSGEPYIDSNGNGRWDLTGDEQYNGVLKGASSVNTTAANTVHVRKALVQVLSGSDARITPLDAAPIVLDECVNGTAFENKIHTFRLAIRDTNPTVFAMNTAKVTGLTVDLPGNLLPAGTTISFSTTNGAIINGSSFIVPNTEQPSAAGWIYPIQMVSDVTQEAGVCKVNTARSGALTVTVRTPSGVITTASYTVTD